MTRRNENGGMFWGARWPLAGALLALLILTSAGSAEAQGDAPPAASVSGTVSDGNGAPVAGVEIDLFTVGRNSYLRSSSTGVDGVFSFSEVDPGCYVVTFIAPNPFLFEDGSGFREVDVCAADGEAVIGIDATVVDRADTATITAEVRERFQGRLVGRVAVDLFTADEDGNRIEYLRTRITRQDGRGIEFTGLAPGCYALTFVAPDGGFFDEGEGPTQWANLTGCVAAGDVIPLNAQIANGGIATVRVIVTDADSNGLEGVVVDLFTAGSNEVRVTYLQSGVTSSPGTVEFEVAGGCYIAVVIAPVGQLFPDGTPWAQLPLCVDPSGFESVIVALA